jgi:hypothetical protein
MYAYENNPNGICEDAPCCGCCGPTGDGRIDTDPYDMDEAYNDRFYDEAPLCENCREDAAHSVMQMGEEIWFCDDCFQDPDTGDGVKHEAHYTDGM